jgi:DDE superfamily endonuclease
VSPRTYPPAPGCSPEGHRIKAPLEYSRGPEKVWVYGALRVRDGKALTLSAPPRNTKGYLRLLEAVAQANPSGDLYLITDNLSSHKSPPIREWLENHPRVEQVFIPWGRVGSRHAGGVWGRSPRPPRHRRRTFVYRI